MAIVVTSLTVLGTACPWKFGGSASAGSASALAAYGSGYNDGSNANGGSGTQNSAYRFGEQHTNVSETGPTTLAVTPGQTVFLKYVSGTVATQGTGAGNSPPTGSTTTTLTPNPGGETNSNGYVMPTNVIPGLRQFNGSGTLNTSTTAVTWVSGTKFDPSMSGGTIWINNVAFTVASVQSPTALTLSATAGSQTGVAFFYYSATTSIGGLVGAFTDASGIIISVFDWASFGGTSVAGSSIVLIAPAGAAFLSLGVNDSLLRDNTGSFVMSAAVVDIFDWTGDNGYFKQYPVGVACAGAIRDQTSVGVNAVNVKQCVRVATYFTPQMAAYAFLIKDYTGQQFPHGGQNSGGTPPGYGQNFPY